jgi:hypothetical protein
VTSRLGTGKPLTFFYSVGGLLGEIEMKGLNRYTDKKDNKIFLIDKEIQSEAFAKSYMTNGLLIYREIFAHFLI